MASCSVCGHDNPSAAKFCSECGAALVAASERREERKVVTVLFADLVGFTSQAEKLDPEDVRAVLAPYWERLRSELERFGGTVEKFIGDAVMALFGAPVAHEDDPERAVRAALAIRDWARDEENLQVRIAVNTGEALVLLGSRPAEGEGMAAGDVVNTAARLQSVAPVNGILVGETTYRATRDTIDYAERDPVSAKGKTDPIAVWEAVEARSRFGIDIEQSALLPLVGRDRELDTILGAFERACREREAQLVTLVGVPGIGKSRLVAELFARLSKRSDRIVYWRQGRSLPYGEGVSYWAFVEMVKAQAGIQENDSVAEAEAKLRASVDAVVAPEERQWVLEHMLPLLAVSGEAPRYGESFPAWRSYVEGLAEQRPLILVFEDLHWADAGLLAFVDHLVEWAAGVSLLVLGTARPELLDRRPDWGGGKLNSTTLALSPLADAEAAKIIAAVLEQALLPAETQQALLERAGGNPLYAEQFARLYLERGTAADMPLPETIQGIVAARLDGLHPDEKRLLQDAAVFGKVFWAGAAAALSEQDADAVEPSLHGLERKGLVRRERRSAVSGEAEFAFRHVLIRDVAYGQIPRPARAERHLRAAGWIERLGRADDHAELLAHHLGSALELARASGTSDEALVERARLALWRGGRRALELHAYPAALQFCTAALELWPAQDPERARIAAATAQARWRVGGEASELTGAIDALEAAGDLEAAAEAAALAANAAWRAGRRPAAEALVERGERLLAGRARSPALCALLAEKARLTGFVDPDAAEQIVQGALPLAGELGLTELQASLCSTLGNVHFSRAEYEAAARAYDEAIAAAPPGSPELSRATTNRSLIPLAQGDGAEAISWLDRAADAAARAGDRPALIWSQGGLITERYYKTGRWDEALTQIATVLSEVEHAGGHYMGPTFLLLRAMILACRGHSDAAAADLEAALARLEDTDDAQFRAPILTESASVYVILGDVARARELLARLADVVRDANPRFAPPFQADVVVTIARCGLGELWLERFAHSVETPRLTAARLVWSGRAAEAADLYVAMGAEEEAAVRLLAAEQLVAEGRRAEADVELERGLAFFRAVGATRVVQQAQRLLAAAS